MGHRPFDVEGAVGDVAGLRIGLPKEYFAGELEADVRTALDAAIAAVREIASLRARR